LFTFPFLSNIISNPNNSKQFLWFAQFLWSCVTIWPSDAIKVFRTISEMFRIIFLSIKFQWKKNFTKNSIVYLLCLARFHFFYIPFLPILTKVHGDSIYARLLHRRYGWDENSLTFYLPNNSSNEQIDAKTVIFGKK